MDLLPKSRTEFTSKDYWEKFFKKRGQKAFEWYGEYNELCGILHKYIKKTDKLLVVGCGNSRISADLYDLGYQNTLSIDISDTVISQMKQQHAKSRPDLSFVKMDVTKLELEDASYSVVFDKGTLDALMPDSSGATMATVDQMFSEITRVLRVGGRYMCVTLAQPHLIKKAVSYFTELGWMIRLCRVPPNTESETRDFYLPVFVVVFTKFKKIPGMKQVIEVSNFEDTVERLADATQLLEAVQGMQQYGMVQQQLSSKSHTEEHLALDLYSSISSSPRYTIHVVDSPTKSKNKFAIFIIPAGRETEWIFCSPDGRAELSQSAGFERLLVVSLHRDQEYRAGMDQVKAELSTKVMELAPPNLGDQQVPFLSVGEDINTRHIRHRGTSEWSGDFVIEDVKTNDAVMRRLVFLNNPSVIQSEVKLTRPGGKKKITSRQPDPHELTFNYYKQMVAGLAFLEDFDQFMASNIDILLVGLGGGSLATFLHNHYENVNLDVVELDAAVVQVATDWFGFNRSGRLNVTIDDGLKHIRELSAKGVKKHIVILDVDNKDMSVGMTCPPTEFVEPDFLKVVDSILDARGVFIMNFVCRNKTLREKVLLDLKNIFKHVYIHPNPGDVNETIFILPSTRTKFIDIKIPGKTPPQLSKATSVLQNILSPHQSSKRKKQSDVVELTNVFDNLTLL